MQDATESIFENVLQGTKDKGSENNGDGENGNAAHLKIESVTGKFKTENGNNIPIPKGSREPTTSAVVVFDSVRSAALAFSRLRDDAPTLDALGKLQKKAKVAKRFGIARLACIRNDSENAQNSNQDEQGSQTIPPVSQAERQSKKHRTHQPLW